MVSKDAVYLIPYPYVGYYYLEDQERLAYANTFSSLPAALCRVPPPGYFHPRADPGANSCQLKGCWRCIVLSLDLEKTAYAELQVFADAEASGEPLLIFPFAIEK